MTYTITIRDAGGLAWCTTARASAPGSAILIAVRKLWGPGASIRVAGQQAWIETATAPKGAITIEVAE